jgi:hypothetical protein
MIVIAKAQGLKLDIQFNPQVKCSLGELLQISSKSYQLLISIFCKLESLKASKHMCIEHLCFNQNKI